MNEEHWLTVEEAANRLKLTTRATHRYGEQKRVKTKRAGRRILFYGPDIDQLAEELGAANKPKPAPKQPKTEMVPAGELLGYLREKDQQLAEQQQQISALLIRLAEKETELGQRLLPADEQQLKRDLATVTAERNTIKNELEDLKKSIRPIWVKWQLWLTISIILGIALVLVIVLI